MLKTVFILSFVFGQSTVEVTGLREGGDIRDRLLAVIMILD